MRYEQLEFDFVKTIRLRRKSWISEHFRPTVGWSYNDDPGYYQGEDQWNSMNNIWKNVMDHVKIGFKLVWKF
jgi:hypothetical protein